MKQAFGGLVDMGVVDERGTQVAYAGPFELRERSYGDQDWFRELGTIAAELRNTYQRHANANFELVARPLHGAVVGEVGPVLWSLLGAVVLVLLIACANVTNIMACALGQQEAGAGRAVPRSVPVGFAS